MKVLCLFVFVAAAVVAISDAASFTYRNAREANEMVAQAIENEMIREEIVSELRKEVGAAELAVEESKPIIADGQQIVREEILVPVETLKLAEPIVEIQEPVAIVMDKEIIAAPVLRSAAPEMVAIEEAAFGPMPAVEPAVPVAIVAEDLPAVKDVVPEIRAQSIVEEAVPAVAADEPAVVEKEVKTTNVAADAVAAEPAAVETVAEAVGAEKDMEMRQAAEPTRPTLIQTAQNTISNLIANNPIANAIQAIRGDDATAASPAAAAPAEGDAAAAAPAAETGAETVTKENGDSDAAAPTPRPTLIQQFQNNVQNFQHQIQSVLQNGLAAAAPGQSGAAGAASGEAPARPGLIATIQQNIGAALNRPLSIFRPNGGQSDTVTEQKEGAMDVEPVATADSAGPLIVNEKVDVVDDKIETDAQ